MQFFLFQKYAKKRLDSVTSINQSPDASKGGQPYVVDMHIPDLWGEQETETNRVDGEQNNLVTERVRKLNHV